MEQKEGDQTQMIDHEKVGLGFGKALYGRIEILYLIGGSILYFQTKCENYKNKQIY